MNSTDLHLSSISRSGSICCDEQIYFEYEKIHYLLIPDFILKEYAHTLFPYSSRTTRCHLKSRSWQPMTRVAFIASLYPTHFPTNLSITVVLGLVTNIFFEREFNSKMANGMDEEGYNDSNRAFLQAFMARSTMTFEEARPVLAAIFSAQGIFYSLITSNHLRFGDCMLIKIIERQTANPYPLKILLKMILPLISPPQTAPFLPST